MYSLTHIFLITHIFEIVIVLCRHNDFRERFLERKRQRQLKDQRIMVLNDIVLKDTEIVDDITHYRTEDSSSPKWKRIRAIEKDFRRLIAMEGMKYNYKRDVYWRTWRNVASVNGPSRLVCYKCNNPILVNATGCQNCGMWTIEERPPPCPYEFFSVISDERLCGANYTQLRDVKSSCPSEIKFSDLTATCDNPIETVWRFSKLYGVPKTYEDIICDGKDFCEIFTSYDISPEHVIFRIINSTNDVMYSRIMKPNNTNYICIEDCGRFNINTRRVSKLDKPLKLDLLTLPKTKRDDSLNGIPKDMTLTSEALWNSEKINETSMSNIGGNEKNIIDERHKIKSRVLRQQNDMSVEQILISLGDSSLYPQVTESHCQKLKKEAEMLYEDDKEDTIVYL